MKFRIIPILLFKNSSLVKSVRFEDHRIVGDVSSSVRVFTKRQADEMIIYDLDAKKKGEFNTNLIRTAVETCNMPLTMGGGIDGVEDASRLIDQGCDKISVCSLLYEKPKSVIEIAKKYGTQAVVATVDYRSVEDTRYLYSDNGQVSRGEMILDQLFDRLIDMGVGEVIFNSIDRDGTMSGYDEELIKNSSHLSKLPLIVSGGCHLAEDMYLADQSGFSGAAAGSIFYWKGDSIISLKNELMKMGSNVRAVI